MWTMAARSKTCYYTLAIIFLFFGYLTTGVHSFKVLSPVERAEDYIAVVAAFGPPLVTTREQTAEVVVALPWYSGGSGGSVGCTDVADPLEDNDLFDSTRGDNNNHFVTAGVFHGGGLTSAATNPQQMPYEEEAKKTTSFANAQQFAGKIVMIPRGACTFRTKVSQAQRHGAVGVIIVDKNNRKAGQQSFHTGVGAGRDISLALSDDGFGHEITIPTEMISFQDGGKLLSTIVGERRKVVAQMGVYLEPQSYYD